MNNGTRKTQVTYITLNLWFAISMVFVSCGIVGNLWTCCVIYFGKTLWKRPTYRILFSIAFPDFISNAFCIPFETVQTLVFKSTKQYVGSDFLCIFEAILFNILMSLSNINQMIAALYRCCAVLTPVKFKTIATIRFVSIILLACSLFPIFFHIIGGITSLVTYYVHLTMGDCSEKYFNSLVAIIYNALFQYISFTISILCYSLIVLRIILASFDKNQIKEILMRAKGSMAVCINTIICGGCICAYWLIYNSDSYGVDFENDLWMKFAIRVSYGSNPVI